MLLEDQFVKLYQRVDFINKLLIVQHFDKHGLIHSLLTFGVVCKHSDSFN